MFPNTVWRVTRLLGFADITYLFFQTRQLRWKIVTSPNIFGYSFDFIVFKVLSLRIIWVTVRKSCKTITIVLTNCWGGNWCWYVHHTYCSTVCVSVMWKCCTVWLRQGVLNQSVAFSRLANGFIALNSMLVFMAWASFCVLLEALSCVRLHLFRYTA